MSEGPRPYLKKYFVVKKCETSSELSLKCVYLVEGLASLWMAAD